MNHNANSRLRNSKYIFGSNGRTLENLVKLAIDPDAEARGKELDYLCKTIKQADKSQEQKKTEVTS